MKDSDLLEQNHRNTTALAFSDFGTKLCEQSFYVSPLNVSAGRARKDQFKSALVLPLHAAMVLRRGTDVSGESSDGYRLCRPPPLFRCEDYPEASAGSVVSLWTGWPMGCFRPHAAAHSCDQTVPKQPSASID